MENYYFEWEKINSIPISALQHYVYCPRQFALIHIEEIYEENIFTLEGNVVHDRVDNDQNYFNKSKKCENNLPVWSDDLGLYGIIDLLEIRKDILYPVEFKRGKLKNKLADDIQLCAQALCLEEMFSVTIDEGAIYYYSSRSHRELIFSEQLRSRTKKVIIAVRKLLQDKKIPKPVNDARCNNCSLVEQCLPGIMKGVNNVKKVFEVDLSD